MQAGRLHHNLMFAQIQMFYVTRLRFPDLSHDLFNFT